MHLSSQSSYMPESWTLTAELQRKIQALEMRCYRTILGISYNDHITNETVKNIIRRELSQYEDLLNAVRKKKLKCRKSQKPVRNNPHKEVG